MVTFDKGGRVPRLVEGTVLDARQVGILVASAGAERTVRLAASEPKNNPGMVARLEAMVAEKGAGSKAVLLFALSTGLLKRLEVAEAGHVIVIEGDRGSGYTVTRTSDA